MRAQSAKVKEGVQKKVAELKSAYADPLFIEYLCQDLEKSKNPIMEGSKIVKELNSDLEKKWQVKQKQKIEELLQKNYPAYNKTPHFREYLYESITASETPLARFKRIEEELEKASQQPPIEWQNYMNRDILARLENIRNDKLFRAYVKIKTQWLENIKDKKPNGTPQQMEDLENHKAYVLTLRKAEEWIGNQLYFNFLTEREANYVKFLEKDFNDLKARHKNQEQQRQAQAQAQAAQTNLAQSTTPSTSQYSNQQIQHAHQYPQQNAQLNVQQNQHQMAHHQQQQQQQHIYTQPQDQNQELKHSNSYHQYQHTQEPVDPPNVSSQVGNNYQNQYHPSSYRTSHNNVMSHNPTKMMNGQMGSQYVDYSHTDNSDQQNFSSPAQNYPVTSQGSHNSYMSQSQRSQQFSYSQQQSGYNQFTGRNQDSINMTRQSSIPSNMQQHQANYQAQSQFSASTDFYSSSAYPQAQNQSQFPQQSHNQVHKAQSYAQSPSVSHNAQSNQLLQFPQQTQVTNAHPNQFDFQTMQNLQQQSGHLQQQNVVSPHQDFSDFISSSQDYSETYVADGKRHRENMGDFFNTNNQNPQGEFWGGEDKNRHLEEYMYGSKKVKVNPLSQPDLHITKSKSNTISSTLTPSTMEGESPQAKQNGIDLSHLRKDPRFVILDEQVYSGSVDLVINRNDNGTLSDYEKITLRIFQDGSKRIEIYGMANIGEFYQNYGDNLNTAMQTGQLETLLEYWLEFLGTCAAKAANKLQEWDDIF